MYCNFYMLHVDHHHHNHFHYNYVVSCLVLVGNVLWVLFQEGWSLNLRLRRGVRQATHTHTHTHTRNNPHVKCTGVYCAYTVNNAETNELNGVQFSGSWVPSLTLTLADRPASYKAAGHCSRYFCRQQLEHNALTLALDPVHCSLDKYLA
jgi:hypothetical protein